MSEFWAARAHPLGSLGSGGLGGVGAIDLFALRFGELSHDVCPLVDLLANLSGLGARAAQAHSSPTDIILLMGEKVLKKLGKGQNRPGEWCERPRRRAGWGVRNRLGEAPKPSNDPAIGEPRTLSPERGEVRIGVQGGEASPATHAVAGVYPAAQETLKKAESVVRWGPRGADGGSRGTC